MINIQIIMKEIKKYTWGFVMVLAAAFLAVFVYSRFFEKPQIVTVKETPAVRYTGFPGEEGNLPDLTYAAENTVNAVVHIMTQSVRGGWSSGNPWLDFFGYRQEPQIAQGFGSGVIISDDGFIITNNHVVEGAEKIKVILNDKREYEARLIGTDPTTDLAVLKVDEKNLPSLKYGNSEAIENRGMGAGRGKSL